MKIQLRLAILSLLVILLCSCTAEVEQVDTRPVIYVGTWIDDPFLNLLVGRFAGEHPEYRFEIKDYYNPDEGDVPDAAVTQMTAQFIVGDTPDLFFLSSMDVSAMKEAGVLADLRPLMEADERFCEENYYMNLWNLFANNGSLYEFVPAFGIGGLFGAERDIGNRTGWTIEEFQKYAANYTGDTTFVGAEQSALLAFMIQYGMSDYVDEEQHTCDFNNESFHKWLNFIKEYKGARSSEAPVYCGWIFGFNEYCSTSIKLNDTYICAGMPQDSKKGPCLVAMETFGISAKTEHTDICWEFMMFLLEEDNYPLFQGFSMRKDITGNYIEGAALPSTDPASPYYGYTKGGEPYPSLSQETVAYIKNLLETIDCLWFRNEDVYDIVYEEAMIYFSEEGISVEETAERIQERVMTCLQETATTQ